MRYLIIIIFLPLIFFSSCTHSNKTLKIAATAVPHAELLESVQETLKNQGVDLKIVELDDYNLPNRLLFEKQVDANFFQHEPYLNFQNKQFGYDLVPLTKVHIEPLGLYSERIHNLGDLKEKSIVAIPNDPTNEARALKLLSELSLIQLKEIKDDQFATVNDIIENPHKLKIEEVDAAFLARALPDVDLAVIPANFALEAKLNPTENALALEASDSPYANIVAVRRGDENKEQFIKLKEALNSEKMREHIEERYKGAIIPAF